LWCGRKHPEEKELGTVVESVVPSLKKYLARKLPWSLNGDKEGAWTKMIYFFLNLK